jgi:transketolase
MNQIKEKILRIAFKSKEGHIPSSFSILDILWVLYGKVLNLDQDNFDNRDKFVLSKGHASLGLYGILNAKGYLTDDEFLSFCEFDSILGGHPDSNKNKFIEASTGSLGHGMPIAVGLALGAKIRGLSSKIYTIVGDGECNEGTIWESALLASHHKLNNFCCIVDYNHSTDRALSLDSLNEKFSSFGFETYVINGHIHEEIYFALSKCSFDSNKPRAIIAETIKGHGIKSIENNWAWHHRFPANEEELNGLILELK